MSRSTPTCLHSSCTLTHTFLLSFSGTMNRVISRRHQLVSSAQLNRGSLTARGLHWVNFCCSYLRPSPSLPSLVPVSAVSWSGRHQPLPVSPVSRLHEGRPLRAHANQSQHLPGDSRHLTWHHQLSWKVIFKLSPCVSSLDWCYFGLTAVCWDQGLYHIRPLSSRPTYR